MTYFAHSRSGKARFVRLGDTDLKSSVDDADVQMFNVARRIAHPDYRKPEKYHDIALLQLDKDVRFNNFVKPACLHTQNAVPDDMPIATGWGLTEPGQWLETSPAMSVSALNVKGVGTNKNQIMASYTIFVLQT